VVHLDEGRLDDAEELFTKALALDSGHQASYARLGNLYVKQRHYAAALDVLNHAVALNVEDPTSFFNLGLAFAGLCTQRCGFAAPDGQPSRLSTGRLDNSGGVIHKLHSFWCYGHLKRAHF